LAGNIDLDRLEAALARPKDLAAYEKPDAATLAAAYACGVLRNHPFADGNKRTAWVIARLFLADNGFALKFDPADAVRTVEAAAGGTLKEAELAAWFRKRITA
jgi:death on curing protein